MGLLIAPALFRIVPDRVLAGAIAGRLFSAVAYLGLACAACLLVLLAVRPHGKERRLVWLIVAMAGLTATGEFALQPILAGLKAAAAPADVMQSALRDRFTAWHGVASGVYLLNCALGAALVVLRNREAG